MKKSNLIHFLNGKFVHSKDANISIFDLGVLRAFGIFDFLVTYKNKPFLINEHIKRLFKSAAIIGPKIPYTQREIKELVLATLAKNTFPEEKSIRILITGGISPDSISPSEKPTVGILIAKRHFLENSLYENGAKVITFDAFREYPQAKSINYTVAVTATIAAKKKAAIEAIYIDKEKDNVFEGTTSNVFLVKNKVILTPTKDTLQGITRETVIHVSKKKFKIEKKNITIAELYNADEVFISASNKEVLPVVKIDSKKIGSGKPGPVTREVMRLYRNYVERQLRN